MDKIKPRTLSGFMELPPDKQVQMDKMRAVLAETYARYGFTPLDTPAIEAAEVLLAKGGGETEKQIYRFTKGDSDRALRFDLTVPLAKYVAANYGQLTFPFRRYQIGKVWRGERAQRGRFREFYQADIDIIGDGALDILNEAEIPAIIYDTFTRLGLHRFRIRVNNRKVLNGFFAILGLSGQAGDVLRTIDKLDKIGADEVARLLTETCGATEAQARACLELAELTASDGAELAAKFDALCEAHGIVKDSESYTLARQGLDTLAMIVDEAAAIRPGSVIADLKIARGLDYYTGSVYETFLDGAASLGSICSGGRYDNLASQGNRKYPGVGLSIGLSRLVSYMLHTAGAHANRVSPAAVLVAVWNEEDRPAANRIANQLRARGIATDVAPTAAKLGKQIKYADKLGIPYVWFPATAAESAEGAEPAGDEVKNIVTGEQVAADCTSWEPDTVVAQQTVEI